MEHTDHQVGRVVDALEDLEILDDTLSSTIIGDNGASAEGAPNGTFNEMIALNGAAAIETPEFMARASTSSARRRPTTTTRSAGRTRWTRRTSGRSRSPRTGAAPATARSCTGRTASSAKGEIRTQFSHVIDVAATVLDAAGTARAGVRERHPADAAARRLDAVLVRRRRRARVPRDAVLRDVRQPRHLPPGLDRLHATRHPVGHGRDVPPLDDDVWELYGPDDWTQAHDLATEMPEKLRELQRLFLIEAVRYNVLPIDDRRVERFNAELAGRPELIRGNTQMPIRRHARPRPRTRSSTSRTSRTRSPPRSSSPKTAPRASSSRREASSAAGASTRRTAARPTATTCSACSGSRSKATSAIPAGEHQVRMEFAYDGGGLGQGRHGLPLHRRREDRRGARRPRPSR